MADIYDIRGIIAEALRCGYDISPADRREWKMFCCALKVLGYDEATFVALSSGKQKDSRQAWRAERNPQRYRNEEQAKGMIVALAKAANMDLKPFLLSQDNRQWTPRKDTVRQEPRRITPAPVPPPPPPIFITPQQVNAASRYYRETSLYIWLCKEFEPAEVERVFEAYKIGGSSFAPTSEGYRSASLPYISVNGECIDCKLMQFSPNNGSSKNADGSRRPITWALARMKKNDRRAKWCNFGDHLLPINPTAPVCVVESEKSALILSLCYRDRIWVAVGSLQNLNSERFVPYRGRKITIFPDRDGLQAWREKARILAGEGFNVSIDTTTERHPGNPKDDLADIVMRWRHGTQAAPEPPQKDVAKCDTLCKSPGKEEAEKVFEEMKRNNPIFAEFAETFQLEPISIEHLEPVAVQSRTTAPKDYE